MKIKHLTRIAYLTLFSCLMFSTPASAEIMVEEVTFDCSGTMTGIVSTPEGPRAIAHVELTIDLPNGAEWRSSGVMVVELPENASAKNISGKKISRCFGVAQMTAEQSNTVKGVDIWSINLDPTQIRVRIGKKSITNPNTVGFMSAGSATPTV